MGPLSGIKIIELKGLGPGPYAGMLLADMGAEVIVVERASRKSGGSNALDIHSRGKKSIALNLKSEVGVETLLKLVEQSDMIFEGFRPGVMERLGIGPEGCLKRNPKIIFGRMTGWGQEGPLSHSAGHDINYISLSGAAAAIGPADKPSPPLNVVGDYGGGSMFLVMGMLSAYIESLRTGEGQVVDTAITEGSASLMSIFHTLYGMNQWTPTRESNLLDGGTPYYNTYETSDGKFMSVGPIEPQFYKEMIKKLELPEDFIADQNNTARWPEIKTALSDTFKSKAQKEWVELFEGSDACVAGILDFVEAMDHPHNVARNSYIEIDGVKQPGTAPKFSKSSSGIPSAPSVEGSDTKTVLKEFGFSDQDIDQLDSEGALS